MDIDLEDSQISSPFIVTQKYSISETRALQKMLLL